MNIFDKDKMTITRQLNSKYFISDALLSIPLGLEFIGLTRKVVDENEISTTRGRIALLFWWATTGYIETPAVEWVLDNSDLELIARLDSSDFFGKYSKGLSQWLKNPIGVIGKIGYQFNGLKIKTLGSRLLPKPLPLPIIIILADRADVLGKFDLLSLYGFGRFLDWWVVYGAKEYPGFFWNPLVDYIDAKADDFNFYNNYKSAEDNEMLEIFGSEECFFKKIISEREDLKNIFVSKDGVRYAEFYEWWEKVKPIEYPVTSLLFDFLIGKKNKSNRDDGFNLIGFPFGAIGLGEDVRMARKCMESAVIPSCLIDVPIKGPKKIESGSAKFVSSVARFKRNIFYLPPTDLLRMAIEGAGSLIDRGSYNIGAMPWELPIWPDRFTGPLSQLDEIWAQSEYVATCYRKFFDGPVIKMPIAVDVPNNIVENRKLFNLPLNSTVYLVMFDGGSWLARKNPLAAVKAFQEAFPRTGIIQDVNLVVKGMNINPADPMWLEILKIASQDDRLVIIDKVLNRYDTCVLIASVDVYVSLHRSEGFGRIIAESMLLGTATVVSNYSGNLDYCNSENSYLVEGDIVPLGDADYIFSKDQYWYEPSINSAAQQIYLAKTDIVLRNNRIGLASTNIKSNFSPKAVGVLYKRRLAELGFINTISQ